ncbi:MAG: DMT family transporter [Arenicellales bacterium]|nr:DMT family transporter [Arenicellales bacterium]
MNAFLYMSVVLIWGTTWIGIYWQLGTVPPLASVFYRFIIAAALLLPILRLLNKVQPVTWTDHRYFLLQGCCLFSFNYICFYIATQYIVSGLASVIFSTATLFNALNNQWFWGEKPTGQTYLAGALGIVGLVLLFWEDLVGGTWSLDVLRGLALAVLGTYLFSLGNMISIRNSKHKLQPLTTSAYSMIYGVLILAVTMTVTQTPLAWDSQPLYFGSLLYLAIPGTILAFTAYLTLIERIGANKAAYATVMFPVVALSLSSVFEGYEWQLLGFVGLVLVLLGNAILLGLKFTLSKPKGPHQ